ncbi:hypothetical protein LC612_30445, partial [Nostoc sp. CHAB 5834]|nr:hypothetical protein [Nostoc sp. CHAB 5834]
PSVVMANVRYPVNVSRLRGVRRRVQSLLNAGGVLEVANGEVSVTPSREELEYTERTRNAVIKALLKQVSLVRKEITHAFLKDYASKWEQVYELNRYLKRLPNPIRESVDNFLVSTTENKEALQKVRYDTRLGIFRMPAWLGGDKMCNAGIGCWRFSAPTGRAKKRLSKSQVIAGRIANTDAVVTPEKDTYAVFMDVHDTKAEARFLNYLRQQSTGVLFLIAGGPEASLTEVQRYAEKLCSTAGIDGLPLKKLSDFELPPAPERAPRARKPKQVVEKPGKNQLRILGVRSASRMEAIVDIPDSERYYVVKDSRSEVSYNIANNVIDDAGEAHFYRCASGKIREAINTCSVFLGEFGYLVEGVAVVNTENQVKQLQLEKKGFKPLFGLTQSVLNNEQNLKRLKAGVQAYNGTDVEAFNFGLLGYLAGHAEKRDALWKKFVSKFGATEIPLQVLHLLKIAEGSSAEDLRMRSLVNTLRSEVLGLQLPKGLGTFSTVSPAYDILQEFRDALKHLNVFNPDQLYLLGDSQPDLFLSLIEPLLKRQEHQVTCAQAQD